MSKTLSNFYFYQHSLIAVYLHILIAINLHFYFVVDTAPEDKITREQAAVILCKVLRLSASDTATKFTDMADVSSWAKDAVLAMEKSGYIVGNNNQ